MNAPDRDLHRRLQDAEAEPVPAAQQGMDPSSTTGAAPETLPFDALLRDLFERAPLGMALLDLQARRVVAGNAALQDLTGCSSAASLRDWPAAAASPAAQPLVDRWCLDLQSGGLPPALDAELRHAQGHTLQLQLSAVRVAAPHDERYAWILAKDLANRRALERQLVEVATRDRLTGLPNRAAMMSQVQALLDRCHAEPDTGFAVLFLDFDRFKRINDTLGHAMGDELLRSIGQRLQAMLHGSTGGMCARFGGDEFVIVAPDRIDTVAAMALAQQLLAACAPPHRIAGHELHASASIGVAIASSTTRMPSRCCARPTRPCTRPSAADAIRWCSSTNRCTRA